MYLKKQTQFATTNNDVIRKNFTACREFLVILRTGTSFAASEIWIAMKTLGTNFTFRSSRIVSAIL